MTTIEEQMPVNNLIKFYENLTNKANTEMARLRSETWNKAGNVSRDLKNMKEKATDVIKLTNEKLKNVEIKSNQEVEETAHSAKIETPILKTESEEERNIEKEEKINSNILIKEEVKSEVEEIKAIDPPEFLDQYKKENRFMFLAFPKEEQDGDYIGESKFMDWALEPNQQLIKIRGGLKTKIRRRGSKKVTFLLPERTRNIFFTEEDVI